MGLEDSEDEFDFKERFESLQNELINQMKEEQSLKYWWVLKFSI